MRQRRISDSPEHIDAEVARIRRFHQELVSESLGTSSAGLESLVFSIENILQENLKTLLNLGYFN